MADILGLLIIRTLYFLNIYGIIRNSVIYIMRVYIPYWHIIFTNESIVALTVFKILQYLQIFISYNFS